MKSFISLGLIASVFAYNALAEKCPFKSLGYKCCKDSNTEVVRTNKYGNWGIEKGKYCGIIDDSCWAYDYGHFCCSSENTKVRKTDKYGKWGKENGRWCGIKGTSKTIKSHMFTEGGSGQFKAVMTEEEGLQDFTFYRPKDLSAAARIQGRLPIILFSNGGCTRYSVYTANILTDIASHGYVIVAPGEWSLEDKSVFNGFFSEEEIALMKYDADSLIDVALDYLEKENKDKSSIFYKTINTNVVAAMGYSCGGLQSLIISTKNDKRIKTTIALNSGANSPGDLLDTLFVKEQLKLLTEPTIYIIGGDEDIAHNNAVDDYNLIDNVPIVLACKPDAGHGGTYDEPNGGSFSTLTVAWLDYILKNNKKYDSLFRKSKLTSELGGWEITQKNFDLMNKKKNKN